MLRSLTYKKITTTAGLEPARAEPKRFLIFRLNRSAMLPNFCGMFTTKEPCCKNFLAGRDIYIELWSCFVVNSFTRVIYHSTIHDDRDA